MFRHMNIEKKIYKKSENCAPSRNGPELIVIDNRNGLELTTKMTGMDRSSNQDF